MDVWTSAIQGHLFIIEEDHEVQSKGRLQNEFLSIYSNWFKLPNHKLLLLLVVLVIQIILKSKAPTEDSSITNTNKRSCLLLLAVFKLTIKWLQQDLQRSRYQDFLMWFSQDVCDPNETAFSLLKPTSLSDILRPSSRHHFSCQSPDRWEEEEPCKFWNPDINLSWKDTHGQLVCFLAIRRWMKASLAKWIVSRVANTVYICIKFTGISEPPPPPYIFLHWVLDSLCRRCPTMCYEANFSFLVWKAQRRNWTRGKLCSVGLRHQLPRIRMWGKCRTCLPLTALRVVANIQQEQRNRLRRGPFNLFLQRRDSSFSIFVPANPSWFLLKSKPTQAWISSSICEPCEEEGAAGTGGSSGSPGA